MTCTGTHDPGSLADCPAYLDAGGLTRCGLPAEIEESYLLGSTDGPLTGVRIRCPLGHYFSGQLESLLIPAAAPPSAAAAAGQHVPQHRHGPAGSGPPP